MTKRWVLVIASLAIAASPALADTSICDGVAGNVVQNCGFETGDFTDWTVANDPTNLTFVGTPDNPPPLVPHSGTDYAVFGNSAAQGDGTISQTLYGTVAGQSYLLTFYYASKSYNSTPDNDFTASWDGNTVLALSDTARTHGYVEYVFDVVAEGSGLDTISFSSLNDPGYNALDDVSVTVSETSILPSILAALAASFFLGRRRLA